MYYKIAVGSRDGIAVTEHFGGCNKFLIISLDEETSSWSFEGFRAVPPACVGGDHSDNALDVMAQALSDCRLVLVSRIGPPAEAALNRHGVEAWKFHGLIEDVITQFLQYDR